MPLQSGARLGRYEIVSPLGAGGMGEVYRARDTRLDRDVAIKILPAAVAADPDRLARFEREAKAVAALSHPNILALHDAGTEDGTTFAVMELLEGETLRERLTHGPLSARRAIDTAVQIARGLAAAHAKGLVHRDLKPENVFLVADGQVKILDFGLAKTPDAGESSATATALAVTDPGTVLGTVGYMAPEQVRGHAIDARTDLFALGAVLYEMLAGQRAFRRDTPAETMTAILPLRISDGSGIALSDDGSKALVAQGPPLKLSIVPTAGLPQPLDVGEISSINAALWLKDGRLLIEMRRDANSPSRTFVRPANGGALTPFLPDGVHLGGPRFLSPDGRRLAAWDENKNVGVICTVADATPTCKQEVAAPSPDSLPGGWTADSKSFYLAPRYPLPSRVEKLDPETGRREYHATIQPLMPAVSGLKTMFVTPDGSVYYSYGRNRSVLYVISGLK